MEYKREFIGNPNQFLLFHFLKYALKNPLIFNLAVEFLGIQIFARVDWIEEFQVRLSFSQDRTRIKRYNFFQFFIQLVYAIDPSFRC